MEGPGGPPPFSGCAVSKGLYEKLLKNVDRRAPRVAEPDVDVRSIREQTGLSQAAFARLLNVSKGTLLNWEQGRRTPTGPARALLKAVASDPENVIRALHAY